MRKKDILYFSKSCRFNDLDFGDKDNLVNKFKDRVYEFYLEPANDLCEKEHAFAAGIICSSTIDFLAKMKYTNHASRNSPQNFKLFLEKDILLPKSSAKDFYKDFRCGLVHGGKIDKCGQFSFDFGELIKTISMEKDIMVVNPKILLEKIIDYFDKYIKNLKEDDREFGKFKEFLEEYFKEDIKYSRASQRRKDQ